ncbi:MAG: 6-phosphogluconolactonase [Methylococcaceae bacterium]|nr:6-phosphogluconolactonase [Methylococcaceae bacterium]
MQEQSVWQVLATADDVAVAVYAEIMAAAQRAIAAHGGFKLVLAGGGTPEKVYRMLAEADTDWSKWWVYYGDERCLPADHADRNSVMARLAFLDQVSIPAEQIFTIPAELGPVLAAQQYQAVLATALPFDVVLLGMGEDGHTASLFPGHQHAPDELAHAVYNSPKPPPERVSISAYALSQAQQVMFIVTGSNKQDAVKSWRAGEELPVAAIAPVNPVVIYIDKAAYGG